MKIKRQRGYLNLPESFFVTIAILAVIGGIACIAAIIYGTWFVATHVSISW